jgi:CrcB protein
MLAVAVGGAIGSVLRYTITYWVQWHHLTAFPVATLVINVSGSLLLGFLLSFWVASTAPSGELRVMLTIGFCGGFTTFSTFGYDTARLMQSGDYGNAALNALLSVGLSIGAVFAGFAIARSVAAR